MFFSSDSAMFTLIWLPVGTELRTPHHQLPGGEIERVLNNLLWKDQKGPLKGQERAFERMRKSLWKDKKGPLKNEKGPLKRHERAFNRMGKDIWKDEKGPLKGWDRAFERMRQGLWKDEKGPLSIRQTLELQLKGNAGECWIIKSISLFYSHKRQGGTLGFFKHVYIYCLELNWTETYCCILPAWHGPVARVNAEVRHLGHVSAAGAVHLSCAGNCGAGRKRHVPHHLHGQGCSILLWPWLDLRGKE